MVSLFPITHPGAIYNSDELQERLSCTHHCLASFARFPARHQRLLDMIDTPSPQTSTPENASTAFGISLDQRGRISFD